MLAARLMSSSQASSSAAVGGAAAASSDTTLSGHAAGTDGAAATARIGAECAFAALAQRFGSELFDQLPPLWDHMMTSLSSEPCGADGAPGGEPQALINSLQVCAADTSDCVCVCQRVGGGIPAYLPAPVCVCGSTASILPLEMSR